MVSRHIGHTATLLPNGKVLITGGWFPKPFSLSSMAELYDPSTETFTPAGSMSIPRALHTATLLRSGKVLIAGGSTDSGSATNRAELYDPSTGGFTPTGNMNIGRSGHRAILLASGNVLIVPDTDGADCCSAELYDPESGTFRATGWLQGPVGPAVFTANLLTSGKVLVTVGPPECDYREESAQFYDPVSETFRDAGNVATPRCYQAGTSLSDGTVLISGNLDCGGVAVADLAAAEVYSPAAGAFVRTDNLVVNRESHTATLLKDGRVLIAGGISFFTNGFCTNGKLPSTAELYTPRTIAPAPTLLSTSDVGSSAILHASTQEIVSLAHPAVAGEVLEIYLTGLIDGSVISPQVAIGGLMAEVLFFGGAPGYPGLNQINVRVPSDVSGPAVPLRLNYLARPSNEVTIAVK